MKFINRDILLSGANQAWKLFSGPLILLFIPMFLTPEHQGFWFTFISVSALSIFAELGFNNIIMQFSSHEAAFAEFSDNRISGDTRHIERLGSLFRFVRRWSIRVSYISFPVIFGIGFIIFSKKGTSWFWAAPWGLYLAGSALVFITNTILSFFEGCHQLGTVQKIRLYSGIVYSAALLLGLYLKLGLFALSVAMILNAATITVLILHYFGGYIRRLLAASRKSTHQWRHEIMNLLWKYAISWSSGYLIFQIYTPLMFHFHGPVLAGQVGITISMWTAIFSISNIWLYTATPKMNMMVAKRQWRVLDKTFIRNLILSGATYLAGIVALAVTVMILGGRFTMVDKVISRFLPVIPLVFIGTGWFLQVFVNGMALYLRAHKQEPLLYVSVASAAFIFVSTLAAAKYLPSDYFFAGFTASYIWGMPAVAAIFFRKRSQWHTA